MATKVHADRWTISKYIITINCSVLYILTFLEFQTYYEVAPSHCGTTKRKSFVALSNINFINMETTVAITCIIEASHSPIKQVSSVKRSNVI